MQEIRVQLDGIEKQVRDLKAQAQLATGQAKLELEREIHEMERKAGLVRDKVKELQSASGEALEELKVGVDSALAELKKSYDRAARYLN